MTAAEAGADSVPADAPAAPEPTVPVSAEPDLSVPTVPVSAEPELSEPDRVEPEPSRASTATSKPRTPRKPPTTRRRTTPSKAPAAGADTVVSATEDAVTGVPVTAQLDEPESGPAAEAVADAVSTSEAATEPDEERAAAPEPAEPGLTEPEPADPEPAEPELAEPEPAEPEPAEPEPAEPEPAEPGAAASESSGDAETGSGARDEGAPASGFETAVASTGARVSSWWKTTRSSVQERIEAARAPKPSAEPEHPSPRPSPDANPGPAAPAQTPSPSETSTPTLRALDDTGEAPVVLSIHGLVKRYGNTLAVENVDLEIRAGAFYGIVGPNGAGKTTTLSIATGLLRPDAGTVTILGTDIWKTADAARAKRSLGVLPDRLRLFDRLTGAQFLYYAATLRGLDGATARKRSADLADAFGLHDALGRLVSDYSVGMTKKVALAAAIIHSPRLLVLDEPFESVDPVSATTVTEILQRYVRGGGTVLLSSHSMDLVERICDSVAVIVDGHVLASGTVDEVRAGRSLQERFIELAGGGAATEGMEWLHNFSD